MGSAPGNSFDMDISVETVLFSQLYYSPEHKLHGIVRILNTPELKNNPFDVVPSVEIYSKLSYLYRE